MPLDTSIYGNIQPVQAPNIADSVKNGLSLSQMAMQQHMMQRQMMVQQMQRQAYAQNLDANGNLNEKAYLSAIAGADPNASFAAQEQIGKANEATAKAGTANNELYGHRGNIVATGLDFIKRLPADQQEDAYNKLRDSWIAAKVAQPGQLQDFTPQGLDDLHMKAMQHMGMNSKDYLDNLKTKSEIAMAPVQRNAAEFGSRSPNAELTSQYGKDVAPIRGSQNAMNQMLDNYNHPSPQGDASLVLNAFKIKFPNAPDVNSLEELTKSQSVPDTWKQKAAHALQGGLDQGTRDNLMRDAASTYRANYDSYQGIKNRYDTRAKFQNVNDPTLTYEPAIEKTYADAMDLQKKIGPYVPPAQRGDGGILGMLGLGGKKQDDGNAYAAGQKATITPGDSAAMQWLNDPKNKGTPDYFSVKAKLKGKGLVK